MKDERVEAAVLFKSSIGTGSVKNLQNNTGLAVLSAFRCQPAKSIQGFEYIKG